MMVEEIHCNDIGTKFLVTVKDGTSTVDISAASEKKLIFKRGNGSVVEKAATFDTDGTDGKLSYITTSGDLSSIGSWKIQAKVILPTGTWRSNTTGFTVYANL